MTKNNAILFAIILFALTVRLAFVLTNNTLPVKDALEYDQTALNLINGKGFCDEAKSPSAFTPPFYPIFLASTYKVFGHNYMIVRMIQAVLGSLLCLIIYAIATAIFSSNIGLVSSLIAAVYPAFTFFDYGPAYLITETLFMSLFCFSTLLLISSNMQPSPFLSALSGFFLGLATLTRPVTLLIPLAVLLWLLIFKASRKNLLKIFIPFLVVFLLTLLPWTIRNYKIFHTLVPISTEGGINFYASHSPKARGLGEGWRQALVEDEVLKKQGLNEAQRSRVFLKKGIDYLKDNPKKIPYLFFRNLMNFWDISCDAYAGGALRYNIAFVFLLPFSIGGMFLGLRARFRVLSSLLVITIIYFSVLHGALHSAYRYRVVIEPFLIIFASFCFTFIFSKLKNKRYFWLLLTLYSSLHIYTYCHYQCFFSRISNLIKYLGLH